MNMDWIGQSVAHYNCFGIGVGPSNLSLACLLHDHRDITNLFMDKKAAFSWHDGQLMPMASLQTSILKDLVTLADPTSRFSFLSYLHDVGQIYHFINAQFDAIPRLEFRNYLIWASQSNKNVEFGEEILSVRFAGDVFVVQTTGRMLTADNIAVGVGTVPSVPPHVLPHIGPTQFHVSEFVDRSRTLAGRRVAVVGGGQSGAEAVLDLMSRPDSELPLHISWISRRVNFLPIDDSPFVNEYYMPSYSEYFARLQREIRIAVNNRNLLASDGISPATLQAIYQSLYKHRFLTGRQRFVSLYPNREVRQTIASRPGWTLTLAHNDESCLESLDVDVVIWATGFAKASLDFLAPICDRFECEDSEYKIDVDFAVRWDGPPDRNIFLLNAARQQRGIADVALSLLAWRSQRVVNRLRGIVASESQDTSFVDWSPRIPNG